MEPFTRNPRGFREEVWFAGQDLVTRVLAWVLIDTAEFRNVTRWDGVGYIDLGPGDAMHSLAKLAELVGTNERAIERARERLCTAGWLRFGQRSDSRRAKTVYHLLEWWRFIEPPIEDPSAGTMKEQCKALENHDKPTRASENRDKVGTKAGQSRDNKPRDDRARTDRAQSAERTHTAADAHEGPRVYVRDQEQPQDAGLPGFLVEILAEGQRRFGHNGQG